MSHFDSGSNAFITYFKHSNIPWLFSSGLLRRFLANPEVPLISLELCHIRPLEEYRRCVEQALAVYHLDSKDVVRGRELVTTEDDTMQIVGLSRMKKGLDMTGLGEST